MLAIGKIRFCDDVSISIARLEDGGLNFRVQESGVCFQFKENYAFGMACEGGYLLAWCADKFVAVDLNTSQLYQHIESDFISEAFMADGLFLVCDTKIVARDIVSWVIKWVYGHPEIIGSSKLDRRNRTLSITDGFGETLIYDLDSGTIVSSG